MPLELDFTQLKDDDFIPPGMYTAQIIEAGERDSRSHFPVLAFVFVLTSPGYEGRRAYYSTSLQKSAMQYTRRALLALGVPLEQLQGTAVLEPSELVGRECRLYFTYSSGDIARTKVDGIYPPEEPQEVTEPIVVPF
jgi:hypothetical protein